MFDYDRIMDELHDWILEMDNSIEDQIRVPMIETFIDMINDNYYEEQ